MLLLLTIACAPAQDPTLDAELRRLQELSYGAYAVGPEPEALHTWLARSFTGDALTRHYVEHYRSLRRMEEEGSAVEVERVAWEGVSLLERTAEQATLEASWAVEGVVDHRGHQHLRANRYRGVHTLRDTDDGWRIAALTLSDMERLPGPLPPERAFGGPSADPWGSGELTGVDGGAP